MSRTSVQQALSRLGTTGIWNEAAALFERQKAAEKRERERATAVVGVQTRRPPKPASRVPREMIPWARVEGGYVLLDHNTLRDLLVGLWPEPAYVHRVFYGILAAVAGHRAWSWEPREVRAAIDYQTLTAAKIEHARACLEALGLEVDRQGGVHLPMPEAPQLRWLSGAYLEQQTRRSDPHTGPLKTMLLAFLGYARANGINLRSPEFRVLMLVDRLQTHLSTDHLRRYAARALDELVVDGWIEVLEKRHGHFLLEAQWKLRLKPPLCPPQEAPSAAPAAQQPANRPSPHALGLTTINPRAGEPKKPDRSYRRPDDWKRLLADGEFRTTVLARIGKRFGLERGATRWEEWCQGFLREVRHLTRTNHVRDPIALAIWRFQQGKAALAC